MLRPFRGAAAVVKRGPHCRTGDASVELPGQRHRHVGFEAFSHRSGASCQDSVRTVHRRVARTDSAHRCACEHSERTRIRPGVPRIFNARRPTKNDVNHPAGVADGDDGSLTVPALKTDWLAGPPNPAVRSGQFT